MSNVTAAPLASGDTVYVVLYIGDRGYRFDGPYREAREWIANRIQDAFANGYSVHIYGPMRLEISR